MNGRELLIGVTGGIAAYKTAALVSQLVQAGAGVTVVMTAAARDSSARRPSRRSPAGRCSAAFSTSPASATSSWPKRRAAVRRPGHGQHPGQGRLGPGRRPAEHAAAGFTGPVLMAPAMNCEMWEKPAVQRNVGPAAADGIDFVDPEEGCLSCGKRGVGRMAAPEKIFEAIGELLRKPKVV